MISKQYLIPVAAAALCTAVLMVFLWWELAATNGQLVQQLIPAVPFTNTQDPTDTLSPLPFDARDAALLHTRQGDIFALRGEWTDATKEYEQAVSAGGGLPALRKLAQAQ